MSKIYWNNLDIDLQTDLKKAVDNTLTPDGTTITKNAEGVISAVGGGTKPATRHWYTTTVTDPLDSTKKVFVVDFDVMEGDFLIVIFNGEPVGRTEFGIVEDTSTGNYIRINSMRPIDYDIANVQGYLLRGFDII